MQETWSLRGEDALEKEMATYSSVLAWEIPWTEEPCGLKELDMTEQLQTKFTFKPRTFESLI